MHIPNLGNSVIINKVIVFHITGKTQIESPWEQDCEDVIWT
jgi:hypothetical protein